jgi:hypothetical protein
MFVLLLVCSCVLMAGLAAVGLLLSADDQGPESVGPSLSDNGLSDLSRVEPR